MAENEGMEGKDLATEEKRKFKQIVLEQVEKLKNGESNIIIGEMEATKIKDQAVLKVRGKTIAIVRGNDIEYNLTNFEELKKTLQEEGQTLDDLGLPDLQGEIDKIQKQNSEKEQAQDQEEQTEQEDDGEEINEEEKDEEKDDEKDDEKPDLEEDDKEKIAEELGIDSKKIYPIRTDSAFYKNHQGMFPEKNLFFFEDEQGKFRVGTRDKDGKPIEDTEHFSTKEIAQMRPVINLRDGRENVTEEIPLQTIEMKNPAKQNGEEDVRDRFIAVRKGAGGYPEFTVVEQSRETGELVGEKIEIDGREYNTHEMNEHTNNTSGGQTPSETANNYNSLEGSSKADDGIQLREIDNKKYKKQIEQDLIRTYGPMDSTRLEELTGNVIERIADGEKREEAIAKVGIKEREQDGRTPGEPRDKRGE